MSSEPPPGIDAAAVTAFLGEHLPELGPPLRFERIGAGRSNLTYRVQGEGGQCVLRRPPLGHVLPTAHDMAREFRVLEALADTPVPAPRPLALCRDPAVNGMPFYLMEYRPGVVIEDRLPPGYAASEAERRRLARGLVETLACLHAVDADAVGLSDFGRPEGYLERQLARWAKQWERSRVEDLPAIDELLRRLAAALPASEAPALVHGDYRLGNVALDAQDPGRAVAVFDWEMATRGDPLADLGYLLMSWGETGDPVETTTLASFRTVTAAAGFPDRAQLVAWYAEASGRRVEAIDFYYVLAFFKLAVISEGIYARHLQGKTVGLQGVSRSSVPLAEHALALAEASALPALRAGSSRGPEGRVSG